MVGFRLSLLVPFIVGHGAERECPSGPPKITSSSSLLQAARTTFSDAAVSPTGLDVYMLREPAPQEHNKRSVMLRPYLLKTYRCAGPEFSSCTECFSGIDCFTLFNDDRGAEYLFVPAMGSESRFHRARVSFHCPKTLNISVEAKVALRQTTVTMTVNGKPAKPHFESNPDPVETISWYEENAMPGEGVVKDLDLAFELSAGYSYAKVLSLKVRTTEDFLVCQDHKACLMELATGGDPGFQLRNDNLKQLQCIEGTLPDNPACPPWKDCLDKSHFLEPLHHMLMAAGVNDSKEGIALLQKTQEDAPDCIQPRIEDPETWLCACAGSMTAICNGIDGVPEAECFTALMCEDRCHYICSSWKKRSQCDGPRMTDLRTSFRSQVDLALMARKHSRGSRLATMDAACEKKFEDGACKAAT